MSDEREPMTVAQTMSFLANDAKAKGFVGLSLAYRISAIRNYGADIERSLAMLRARRQQEK